MDQVSFSTRFKISLITLLLSIILPIMLICFIPIYMLRYIASLFKRLLCPHYGKLLTSISSVFATDAIYTKPRSSVLPFFILEGELSLENVRTKFRQQIVENVQNRCKFSEIFHFPSTFMGFPVWVPESEFSVENHIKHYEGPVDFDILTETVLLSIVNQLTWKAFTPKKSPWEIYVLNNYFLDDDLNPQMPKSVLILQIHHCLADGYSILNFIQTLGNANKELLAIPKPNYPKRGIFKSCVFGISLLFRFPYDLASRLVLYTDPIGDWVMDANQLSQTVGLGMSPKIPFTYVRKIRDCYKSTTTGIIMAAISGSMRRVMLESGKKVPNPFTILTPIPVKGHPNKLRNHVTIAFIALPVGTEDALDRLRIIERHLKAQRQSTLPLTMLVFTKFVGSLFQKMTRIFSNFPGVTLLISNFPGPTSSEAKFLDHRFLATNFVVGGSGVGMSVAAVVCTGNLRIVPVINEAILENSVEWAQLFSKYILSELDLLLAAGGEV